jgi:hypothetical protein
MADPIAADIAHPDGAAVVRSRRAMVEAVGADRTVRERAKPAKASPSG